MAQAIFEIKFLSNGGVVLNDLNGKMREFTDGSSKATRSIGLLNNSFTGLTRRLTGLVGIYTLFNQTMKGYDLYTNQQVALQRLNTTFEDNKKYTKENLDNLHEFAIKEEGLTGIYREQINAMEASILAHHDIKVSMQQIIPAVIDYATATGTNATEATKQLSRVLGNPLRAMQLLRTAHIDITKEQQKWMTGMYESGHYVEYQTYILDQLEQRYKGAAENILAANPGLQLKLQWREAQAEIGHLATLLLVDLMPAIKNLIIDLRHWIEWGEKHKNLLELIIKDTIIFTGGLMGLRLMLGTITTGMTAYNLLMGVFVTSTEGATVATEGLTAAMDVNPIFLMISAIGGLIAAYGVYKAMSADEDEDLKNQLAQNTGQNVLKKNISDRDRSLQENSSLLNTFAQSSQKDRMAMATSAYAQYHKSLLEQSNLENERYDISNTSDVLAHKKRADALQLLINTQNEVIQWMDKNMKSKRQKLQDSTANSSSTGTDIAAIDDIKGSGHISNTWNIRNFGINESTFKYDTLPDSKTDVYRHIMEVLTAAMRDGQENIHH